MSSPLAVTGASSTTLLLAIGAGLVIAGRALVNLAKKLKR